jgi:uncharacterized membrane protein YkgB
VLLFPVFPPELLGGLTDGLPLLVSGVVVGGFEFGLPVVLLSWLVDAPELLWPALSVLSGAPEFPVVADPGLDWLLFSVLLPELEPLVAFPVCPV